MVYKLKHIRTSERMYLQVTIFMHALLTENFEVQANQTD